MLDTIKVAIPLNALQHKRISDITLKGGSDQWVKWCGTTGEIQFRRLKGLANCDQNSFHRQVLFDVSLDYASDNTWLTCEFSLPKFWYGHNIALLYGYIDALQHFKTLLEEQFKLKRKPLADVLSWRVWRLDACYAWQFPTQDTCHKYLDSLKRLHFPRKVPAIYATSIVFTGITYTVKFYEKFPEFKLHDRKELLSRKATLEWIEHLEKKAEGVLRYELTLRRKYLKRQGIDTIADLLKPEKYMEFDSCIDIEANNPNLIMFFLTGEYLRKHNPNFEKKLENGMELSSLLIGNGMEHPLEDGMRIECEPLTFEVNGLRYEHPGGGFTFRSQDKLSDILSKMLTKFLGANVVMQTSDKVKVKLLEHYKPVKAARLIAFWLYVQKFGTEDAKETYGRDSYYSSKRDLKAAGVSLIEPNSKVVPIDRDFLARFKMQVPSEHAVNKFDEYRDHDNVLNLPIVNKVES